MIQINKLHIINGNMIKIKITKLGQINKAIAKNEKIINNVNDLKAKAKLRYKFNRYI